MVAAAIVAGVVIPVAHRCVDERPSERFTFVQVSLELRALASVKPDRRRRLIFQRRVALCGFRFAGVVLLRCSYSCAYIFASIAFRCVEGVTCLNSLRRHFIVFIFFMRYYRSSFCRAFIITSTPRRQSSALECVCRQYRVFVIGFNSLRRYFISFTIFSRESSCVHRQLPVVGAGVRSSVFLHRLVRRYYVASCIVNLVCVALTCLVCSLRLSRT